jgi:uncharacterized protein (TIGR00251 family)
VAVRVSPGASRSLIRGIHGGALKVFVQAPPDKGKANKEVLKLFGAALGVKPSSLSVLSGTTSRDKVVLVRGVDAATVQAKLRDLIE